MALSWTMDKLGPICRSAEDCALVLEAIYGPDGKDASVYPAAFHWHPDLDWKALRIGYLKSAFEPPQTGSSPPKPPANETAEEKKKREDATPRASGRARAATTTANTSWLPWTSCKSMGVNLIPVEIAQAATRDAMTPLLTAEAAAAFDDLTIDRPRRACSPSRA